MLQMSDTVSIMPLQREHLPQVQRLINTHLSAMVPGWALSAAFIARRLQRNPAQDTLDPWVRACTALCAIARQRVVAAAHLLRYGDGPEVGPRRRARLVPGVAGRPAAPPPPPPPPPPAPVTAGNGQRSSAAGAPPDGRFHYVRRDQ
jgi:hypothetical protein